MVSAKAYVEPWEKLGSPLPDENATSRDLFSAERLDPEILRVTVSAVPR